MTGHKTNIETGSSINLGVIVPIDVEALCIGKDQEATFEKNPFDFGLLKSPPYLSSSIATGGLSTMDLGVHLHWALPDALSKGNGGSAIFPAIPDRWLVARIFCDPEQAVHPRFDYWVVESNYYSLENSNENSGRESVTIPYGGDGWEDQPWRHMGKVLPLSEWLNDNSFNIGGPESYISKLTAVGYGQPDFAAFYQNSKSSLGFNDLAADLENLGIIGNDKYLSYQITGWFSDPALDPIRQLPDVISATDFNLLLTQIANQENKAKVLSSFIVKSYDLAPNIPVSAGQQLWDILAAAGFPLEIAIPVSISPPDFQQVLKNTPNEADQEILNSYYIGDLGPVDGLSGGDRIIVWDIMANAGFNFIGRLLSNANWSIPSGTVIPAVSPGFTLYSGLITNVVWNGTTDYFTNNPADNFNIAIGNTPGEALSALIANTAKIDNSNIEITEDILNALQAGILNQVDDTTMLPDWEELKDLLHQYSFSSERGGYLWQIKPSADTSQNLSVSLPDSIATLLNELNILEQELDRKSDQIISSRSQIFYDWFRFIQVLYSNETGIHVPIQPGDLAPYINQRIDNTKILVDEANLIADKINAKSTALNHVLGNNFFLSKITAPRYWQPNDPVVLFQGDGITPTDRFGNDGRYMYNNTLLCRLGDQLVSKLEIPAGAFGNQDKLMIDASQFQLISNPASRPILTAINSVIVDTGLLNCDFIASELRFFGVNSSLKSLVELVEPKVNAFLTPGIPAIIVNAEFERIENIIYPDDKHYLDYLYVLNGENYLFTIPEDNQEPDYALRLPYIFNSSAYNPAFEFLIYTGLPFSNVGIQKWNGNPWLPYSLKWSVFYYPLLTIKIGANGYPKDFITSQFRIGDANLEYTGPTITPGDSGINQYSNTIFLTPHAGINLKKQLEVFIENNKGDKILSELELILSQLPDKPVLSQALSGFNEAMLMLHREMQLPVADPFPSSFHAFSNQTVPPAVGEQNTEMPVTDNFFNPIRVGLMKIDQVVLVDVFGRNVTINKPPLVYRPYSLMQKVMQPDVDIYLPPRLTESSRLIFRWLSADNDLVEMNSVPASSPVCGWVLTNNLDSSLWIYDNYGNSYGSLILNWNITKIIWQCAPGSPFFNDNIIEFFASLKSVNKHLENFVLALYGTGGPESAVRLESFMNALNDASLTIEPANNKQFQTNAVLMGRPMALVRASIDLELMGTPDYSQSWEDLEKQVNEYTNNGNFISGNDYNFSKVNFPVKIGNITQTEDGLIGYFKNDDYSIFYCPSVETPSGNVVPPTDNNLLIAGSKEIPPVIISMLVEPRGKIHASTGILPVKSIEIPPYQYLDTLQRLQLCFLTSPVLTGAAHLAMPLPAQSGGFWSWVENDGDHWSDSQQIAAVTVNAVLNYMPQEIIEGWLNLSNIILSGNSFSLINNSQGKAVLFITEDPANNTMIFTFTNKTGMPVKLRGGTPISGAYQSGGSSLVFNFSNILPDAVFKEMKVTNVDWASKYFAAGAGNAPAVWAVAPIADLILNQNDSVSFDFSGITCPPGTIPGNFQVGYFGLIGLPDCLTPVLIAIAILKL